MFVLLIATPQIYRQKKCRLALARSRCRYSEGGCAHSDVAAGKSHFKSVWRRMVRIVTRPFSSSRCVCGGVRNASFICINIRRMPIHSYVESAINPLKRQR
ncbi:hypothetical protein Bxe_A3869 [Paraburkholderia xenovorans LB400]|uniref:Uncharacterized protein n=1 Tax=Paraburkholderia xenovorans (strain LB400) TaxID=266265 RepID=Q144W0_PARXL|nr:hypothetical protein Bxe_A3869 [Paraburkholderia xenovorans LB400]